MNYWGDNKGCVSDYFCVVVLIWLLHASKRMFEHWNSYKAIFKIYRPLRFAIGSFVLRKLHLFVSCLNQLSDHKPCHNIWSTVHIHLKDLIDNHLVNTPTNSRPLETIIIDGALVVAVGTPPLQTPLVRKNVQLQVSTIARFIQFKSLTGEVMCIKHYCILIYRCACFIVAKNKRFNFNETVLILT